MNGVGATWFKSSYSGGANTECVEAAFVVEGIAIRDSKEPGGPVLRFGRHAWSEFVSVVGESGPAGLPRP